MALAFQSKNKKGIIMIFYLSGGEIEEPLKEVGVKQIDLMLSFFISKNKPEKRFLKIYNERRRIQKKKKQSL